MTTDYDKITEENIKKYGTDIDRYGPVLLAKLYSDRTHFVYELLQNAEDAKATWVKFHLFRDRLEVRHNGRPFNHNDVRGICGLVESTKKEDLTQIGKFGIGFKSVYAYTSTPQIHSGVESFCIEYFVRPRSAEKKRIEKNETLFVFPFDHKDVSVEKGFEEIAKRLRELGSRTVLFLNNIERIEWEIECKESGTYKRKPINRDEHPRRVFVLSNLKNQEKEDKEEFLIFDRPIKSGNVTQTKLKVEVAFKIDKNKENKEVIVPIDNSSLVVFFPTEKETHLKFLIQGPYRTTPARDNVPKDDPLNAELIKETALLVADSLSMIRDLSLLTTDFLNVLPINKENFPEDHMFRPIFDAVLNKLRSGEKLLPANDGGYISAKQAFLARGKDLINLLNPKQLSWLFGKEDCQWLNSNITQDKAHELRMYLIEELKVQEITPERFANQFTEEFMKEQDDEWVIRFYTFLKDQKALWRNPEGPLRKKSFIRLENNTHEVPFDDSGKPRVYLPSDFGSSFPTVKKSIAENKEAKEFLKDHLKLKEPDKFDEVIDFILPKYKGNADISDWENINDVKRIIEVLKNVPRDRKQNLIDELKSVHFLKAVNPVKQEKCFCTPYIHSIYLTKRYSDDEILETYFDGNPDIFFLDDVYKDFKKEDLLELGCLDKVRVKQRESNSYNGNISINNEHSNHKRGLDGFDPDCEIEGIEYALKNINKGRSIIIWNLLKQNYRSIAGVIESSSRQDYEYSKKEDIVSKMGRLVREKNWLPNKNGDFCKPSDIFLSELPDDFDKESSEVKILVDKLVFKKDEIQQLLSQLPENERRRIELAKTIPLEKLEKLAAEEAEEKEGKQFPVHPVHDEERRKQKAVENYKNSPKKEYEKRNRSVRISNDSKDKRIFLREWYQDNDGRIICQMCQAPSFFKNRKNEYYFEATEIVDDEIEYDANNLALCPLCAAKYQNGERTEDEKIKERLYELYLKRKTMQRFVITIDLCGEQKQIQFVEKHLIDLLPIFEKK